MIKLTDILLTAILIFLIVFTPLAFGTVESWSILVFQMSVLSAAALWLARGMVGRELGVCRNLLFIPAGLFVCFAALQLVPIAPSLLNALSSKALEIQSTAYSLLGAAPTRYAVSLYENASSHELINIICYALVFFLTANEVRSLKSVTHIFSIMLTLAFCIAVFALIQKFSWNGKIYWVREIVENSKPFGPFANYDHYGGYINMLIMASISFLFADIQMPKKVMTGFAIAIMIVSLLLSQSRGAVLSFVGGLVYLLGMLVLVRRNLGKEKSLAAFGSLIGIILFVLLFVYWVDLGVFLGRLKSLVSLESNFFDMRIHIWRDSWTMVKDFLITGSGIGTYEFVFPMYQESYTHMLWRNAHNDYLQLLIETGIGGTVLAAAFLAIYFSMVIVKVRDSSNDRLAGFLISGSAAVVAMLVHSTVDFNLRIPANAFMFSFMLGVTTALAGLSKDNQKCTFLSVSHPAAAWALGVGGLTLLVCLAIPAARQYQAQSNYIRYEKSQSLDSLQKAADSKPRNARYRRELGLAYQEVAANAVRTAEEREYYLGEARLELEQAILNSPAEGIYWASYGWLCMNTREKEKAEQSFARALQLTPASIPVKRLYEVYKARTL